MTTGNTGESPIKVRTKFPGPDSFTARTLVREYSGEALPVDPGPGPVETSYRFYREFVRRHADLAGEEHLAVFLRRLFWAHFQKHQKAAPRAPDRPSFMRPKLEPIALPKGNGRIELDAEQAKVALFRAGACQSPQPHPSRYFLAGRILTREEGGHVLQTWEVPK